MKLNDRKLKILQAIIHSYITSAEPVGSRAISKKYELGVSPATIRNEMADLEELGFLTQPYTSAGRIPSDKAYRLYVNGLLQRERKIMKEKEGMKKLLAQEIGEIEKLLQNSAKILSKITNYTSLAIAPQVKESKLKHIQLVPVDETKILVVIVTESGLVKNAILRVDNNLTTNHLNRISNFLNSKLKGHNIANLRNEIEDNLIKEMYKFKNTIDSIIPLVNQTLDSHKGDSLYSEGVTNIFDFPEYSDIEKAKAFLSFIENRDSVLDMLINTGFNDIEIRIGEENNYEEIKDCSLITATYRFNGKTIGKIGVIGPTRMEYSKVISVVRSLALVLSEIADGDKYKIYLK
ncbi:heat-inducible transcriptional repressor HrcA [Sporosalibacterium faouarense]|uniref:heat-inducible transcriptional repressor HrcA n=1 Tax=Sporosalibacterium faouarense TaxID=516123 RepID=UPI00141D0616|nr:heat-inducible transcriptional repressor HrcA [Sporosalibacterium faouarense]MTI49382.1 heat-inducible transcription repressor HrcA [Bacillota bacterium]